MEETDHRDIEMCLDGHPEAFRQLVDRYHGAVVSFLLGQLGNEDMAEEAAQEAFVRAYFSLGKLRKKRSFFSWLLGIAVRAGKEVRRSQRRQEVLAQRLGREGDAAAEESAVAEDGGCDSPSLERAVTQLPPVYRDVVLLRYYGGQSCAQAAQRLDVPLGTVTKRLSRAYALLRSSLSKDLRTMPSEHEVQR